MTIPWRKIAMIFGLGVSSTTTALIEMHQTKKMVAEMGQSMGEEVIKTVKREMKKNES